MTTDTPQDNDSKDLNRFYVKDGEIWVRDGGSNPACEDVCLWRYFFDMANKHPDVFHYYPSDAAGMEWDFERLKSQGTDTLDGIAAMFYMAAWACVNLREALKEYEDSEESGSLVRVVRCRDCRYADILTTGRILCTMHSEEPEQISTGYDLLMEPDDYCSYGTAREESKEAVK